MVRVRVRVRLGLVIRVRVRLGLVVRRLGLGLLGSKGYKSTLPFCYEEGLLPNKNQCLPLKQ